MEKIARFMIALVSLAALACSEFPEVCLDEDQHEDMRVHICMDRDPDDCEKLLSFARPFIESTVGVHTGYDYFRGSGFVIEGNRIVTKHHVIDDGPDVISVSIRTMRDDGTPNWECRETIPMKVEYSNEETDIAVLVPKDPNDASLLPAPLKVGSETPDIKEKVWMFGKTSRWSWGVVYGYQGGGDKIISTMPIEHGDSGSPMVNGQGEVVGIISNYVLATGMAVARNIQQYKTIGVI